MLTVLWYIHSKHQKRAVHYTCYDYQYDYALAGLKHIYPDFQLVQCYSILKGKEQEEIIR